MKIRARCVPPVCAALALLVLRVGAVQPADPGDGQDAIRQVAVMAKVIDS